MKRHLKGLTITHINYIPTAPKAECDTITEITTKGLEAIVVLLRKKVFFFFSKAAISEGDKLMVDIHLSVDQEVIRASGHVTSAKKTSSERDYDTYNIGMKFVLISKSEEVRLSEWLESANSGQK